MQELTYLDFALDELQYISAAYNSGLRYSAMVSQCQRIVECYLKYIIARSLVTNTEVMMKHDLRAIYEWIVTNLHLDLSEIRADVMLLNNFYTHTRYPGRTSYLAKTSDIDAAFLALGRVIRGVQPYI